MLRRRAALGVNHPILCFAAQNFRKFFRPVGEYVAEPGFAPRAAFQQSFRCCQVAPL